MRILLFTFFFVFLTGCNEPIEQQEKEQTFSSKPSDVHENLITDHAPMTEDGHILVAIEIPAGTSEKWEVNKNTGQPELEVKNQKPRIVKYLGYPANYGMIPQTLLPKKLGGDGDPLDVIVLGDPIDRGTIVKCKLLGVLKLLDRGEQDDKLIAVREESLLYPVNDIYELEENYNGILDIIETWFTNYKGTGKMKSQGYLGKQDAAKILKEAILAYAEEHDIDGPLILPE